jgi:hypothetical protein
MFGFPSQLPVSEEERLWVDQGFPRLEKLLGRRRMLDAPVILPTAEHFPDHYDKTPAALEKLLKRVCGYMEVDRKTVELDIFPDEAQELQEMLPAWRGQSAGNAGAYFHPQPERGGAAKGMLIAIRATQLEDPLSLVATVAHELGHVILLGGGLLDHKTPDHEPMTDLLTVFLGLGIFTANSSERFKQFQDDQRQGWSMQRLGYLPQDVFGYALAKFAAERAERKPKWADFLSTNVRAYFKRSAAWLEKNGGCTSL